jgi:fucose 4-O-acetylase-like acetyltransferase
VHSNQQLEAISPFLGNVYYFHIPVFLVVSGLFIKAFSFLDLRKRMQRILVPYLFWYSLLHKKELLFNPLLFSKNFLIGNYTHALILWFLPTLFSLGLILSLIEVKNKRLNLLLYATSTLTIINAHLIAKYFHEAIPMGIHVAFFLLPIIIICKSLYINLGDYLKSLTSKRKFFFATAFLSTYLLCSFLIAKTEAIKEYGKYRNKIDLAHFYVPETIVGYLSMLLICVSIMGIFLVYKVQILTLIGKYSLPIYLLHGYTWKAGAFIVSLYIPSLDNIFRNIVAVVVFLSGICIPILVSKILTKFSPKFCLIGFV